MFADGATTKKSARNFLGNDVTLVSRWPKSAFVYLRNPTVTKKSKKQKNRFAQPLYYAQTTLAQFLKRDIARQYFLEKKN